MKNQTIFEYGWRALGFKTYNEYLNSYLWKSKKEWMINNIGKCDNCRSKKDLLVHHKSYKNTGNEKLRDLQVLCWDCHKKIHKKDKKKKGDYKKDGKSSKHS